MAEHGTSGLENLRVVIVEDEGMTQMMLRRILQQAGLEVVGQAIDGAQGVELVLREAPDLVLMDIRMPVMDGLEALERIQEQAPTCVVMLTAYDEVEYRARARRLGASGYLNKPVSSLVLMPELEKAIRNWRPPWT